MSGFLGKALVFAGNVLVRPLSSLIPRDQRRWAFGAPDGRFEGNTKHLFLWLSLHPTSASPVWITTNRMMVRRLRAQGLPALYRWSPRGLLAAARAGVYVVNDNSSDINFPLGGGAKIFNLWHGVGLKNVHFGAKVGFGAHLQATGHSLFGKIRNMRRFERSDWVLATSPDMANSFFKRCFDLPVANLPALGYPRLDPVLDNDLKQLSASFEDYAALVKPAGITKSIVFVPTVRRHESDILSEALPDIEKLSAALKEQSAELLLKLHPKRKLYPKWRDSLPYNIRILPETLDIYPIIDRFDAMITDYSSLFFDYIQSRAEGMVLYPFDYDRYTSTERDLAWDYDEVTVGLRVDNFASLCEAIRTGRVFDPLEPGKLAALRERFWGGEPALPTASARIVDYLLNQVVDK